MDLGTIGGFMAAIATLSFLVFYEGDASAFANMHAGITIGGGIVAATLIRFPLKEITTGLMSGIKFAFAHHRMHAREIVIALTDIAQISRKHGPLGLEKMPIADGFLAQAVRMLADGYDRELIRLTLERERDLEAHRLETGVKVYKSIGDGAPAFGMVGTIIGMVQMFMNMEDPSKLGPFMAIALLATLYGAVIANFVCLPIAEKLEYYLAHDELSETMIIDGIMAIQEGKSPVIVRELLQAYIPKPNRDQVFEAA